MTADDQYSPAEKRFLDRILARARGLDPYVRGLFAESLICELLGEGAEPSPSSIAPHDIDWQILGQARSITIAVRATGEHSEGHDESSKSFAGSWNFPPREAWVNGAWSDDGRRRCRADVAVLARHHGFQLNDGWDFFVLPSAAVESWPATVLRPSTVSQKFPPVSGDELPAAVRDAFDSTVANRLDHLAHPQ